MIASYQISLIWHLTIITRMLLMIKYILILIWLLIYNMDSGTPT